MLSQIQDGRSVVAVVRALLEGARARFDEFHRAIEDELGFSLDHDHYTSPLNPAERSLRRLKPNDPGLYTTITYNAANLMKRFPVHVETRPMTRDALPDDVEAAKNALEHWLNDPIWPYKTVRRDVVVGSMAARAWGLALEYDSRTGLRAQSVDPRNVYWADGFERMHDPRTPWAMRECRLPAPMVRKLWPNAPSDLRGDDGKRVNESHVPSPAMRDQGREALSTVLYAWFRFEPEGKTKSVGMQDLSQDVQYLACPVCGWKSPPQIESTLAYPLEAPCPDCGGPAGLVDRIPGETERAKYPGGRRLVISLPFSGHEEPLYDGAWEFDYPTFPLWLYQVFPMPHKPVGQSYTSILKTSTLTIDAMTRLAYETLLKSRPFYHLHGSLKNARGGVFEFTPLDGDVMYSDALEPSAVNIVQGQGVNPSVFAMVDRVRSVFESNKASSQIAMNAQQLKEAKVGSLQLAAESGNVMVDDHGDLLYDMETQLLNCVAVALRALPEREVRYRDASGSWRFKHAGGPLMPQIEVQVGAGYSLDALDKEEIEAYQSLISIPPQYRRGFARFAKISPDVLNQIEQDEAEAQAQAMPMAGGAAPPALPQPNGVPMGAPPMR